MSRGNFRKISFEDAFDNILNGNVSELEDLSSDEDIDENEDVACIDYGGSDDDNDDSDNDSSDDNGSCNDNETTSKEAEKTKFRWRKKDFPTSDETFIPDVDNIEETKSPLEYFRQ